MSSSLWNSIVSAKRFCWGSQFKFHYQAQRARRTRENRHRLQYELSFSRRQRASNTSYYRRDTNDDLDVGDDDDNE